MRLLLFTDTINDVNGVARFLRTLGRWARFSNHALLIMSSSAKARGDDWADETNIEIFPPRARMALPGYRDLDLTIPRVRSMLQRAREFGPDVIHVSTPGPVGLIGAWIASRLNVPLVGTWHTNFPMYVERLTGSHALGDVSSDALALFYQRFALVLARSPASLPDIRAAGVPRSRDFRPGVDLQRFSPSWKVRDIWRAWGLDPDRAKVLYVGRISKEKSVPMLIDALANLSATDVIIVGDGPYGEQMRRQLPQATYLGFQHGDMLSRLYASSDLVVFPSTTDTLGQVSLEAQASGVCVMVSNQGGPAHSVKHGVTGMIVMDQDPRLWRQCINALVADRDRLRTMGAAAVPWMQEFSMDASCGDFWQAHVDLLDQLRARRA